MRKGLTYDDVLVIPQRSSVDSRSDVDLSTRLSRNIEIDIPITSAPMDTVTEQEMAQKIADLGGCGFIHRFIPPEVQESYIEDIDGTVVATVGIDEDYVTNSIRYEEAGADAICIDVAHAYMDRCLDALSDIAESVQSDVIVGNMGTRESVSRAVSLGADGVKIGIGPGSHCTTREVAGVGVPQLTAVMDAVDAARDSDATIIADGGIKKSGDIVKAIAAGADCIMAGGLFAGCKESPAEKIIVDGEEYKVTRGMASREARESRTKTKEDMSAVEGEECLTKYTGRLETTIDELTKGIRSGFSYSGAHTVDEMHGNAELIQVSPSTKLRNGTHGVLENQ